LDHHIVANRILRKDNFLIALINNDILNLDIPFVNYGPILTKLIEWNIRYGILTAVFNENGSLRKRFLKKENRRKLIARFLFS
jgi:autophagy-related protein 9